MPGESLTLILWIKGHHGASSSQMCITVGDNEWKMSHILLSRPVSAICIWFGIRNVLDLLFKRQIDWKSTCWTSKKVRIRVCEVSFPSSRRLVFGQEIFADISSSGGYYWLLKAFGSRHFNCLKKSVTMNPGLRIQTFFSDIGFFTLLIIAIGEP